MIPICLDQGTDVASDNYIKWKHFWGDPVT